MRPHWVTSLGTVVLLGLGVGSATGQELTIAGEVPVAGPALDHASQKIAAPLRGLIAQFASEGITRANAAGMGTASRFSSALLRVDDTGRVQVYVTVADPSEPSLAVLQQRGLDIELVNRELAIVQGWIPVENLGPLASEAGVVTIRPPSYGAPRTGSVDTQGDAIHRCDQVRAASGLTGVGATVGVVSDGVDSLAASQMTGDLGPVQVLLHGSGDEGTALLQIIHDCAPGAALAFATVGATSLTFISAVNALRAAGATIIVDDFGFLTEPYFQDGMVALNDRVVGASVLRVSAAGNDRRAHYQGTFTPGPFDPQVSGTQHIFGGGQTQLPFRVAGGQTVVVVLQWADPFGMATDDYDLCARQTNGVLVGCSATRQTGHDDPIEALGLICPAPPNSVCGATLEITQFAGVSRALQMFCFGACVFDQFNVPGGSIFEHAAVPEVLAVAAANASTPTLIEPYSSAGPSTILIPASESRLKPDLTGVDCVATSLPFPFNPFCGTSAAAPHVAGVAALLLQANPSYAAFVDLFRAALRQTAVDLGPPGWDPDFGFGRADALNAVQPELSKASCQIQSDKSTVAVGGQFTLTVQTVAGTGDPWDVYLLFGLLGPPPAIFTVDLASGNTTPMPAIQPSRPTAAITTATTQFTYTAPAPGRVAFLCLLASPGGFPGFTRVSRFSLASVTITP